MRGGRVLATRLDMDRIGHNPWRCNALVDQACGRWRRHAAWRDPPPLRKL